MMNEKRIAHDEETNKNTCFSLNEMLVTAEADMTKASDYHRRHDYVLSSYFYARAWHLFEVFKMLNPAQEINEHVLSCSRACKHMHQASRQQASQ